MYSMKKVKAALRMYHKCGSVTETIRTLGYPSRQTMYTWIDSEGDSGFARRRGSRVKSVHPL